MKTLVVTDIHLMEEELPYTKQGVHNSKIILDELIKLVSKDKEIGLIIMLGDITDSQPVKLETKMAWGSRFDKLSRIVNSRHEEMPEIKYWGRDGKVGVVRNRLMSIKGNHDFRNNDRWNKTPSYFDELVDKGQILNPEAIEFEDNGKVYHYQLRNYGEGDKTLLYEATRADKVVVFAHDWLVNDKMPEEYLYWASKGRVTYKLDLSVAGADDVILGHSHSRYEPITLTDLHWEWNLPKQKERVTIYIPGTNARTPNTSSMYRDEGYNLLINTEEYSIDDISIWLKPYEVYFDKKQLDNK